jgi:hypothetical protein
MTPVESLLREIDVRWKLRAASKIPLRLIGSAALLLQTQYNRGTKDSDVLETAELTAEARDHLLAEELCVARAIAVKRKAARRGSFFARCVTDRASSRASVR